MPLSMNIVCFILFISCSIVIGAPVISQQQITINASVITTNSLSDLIPLSGSLALVGNTSQNTVDIFDVDLNITLSQISLIGEPAKMVVDLDTSLVYVSIVSSNRMARVNVIAATVSYVTLPSIALDFAFSSTSLYVLLQGQQVVVFDKTSYQLVGKATVDSLATRLVVANDDSFFITGAIGYSGGIGGASRYEIVNGEWNNTQTGINNENANTLVLSPDNQRVELVCGGGNGNGYSIVDTDATDFTQTNGAFQTGAYPLGGVYTPDQVYFISSNYNSIIVFSANRHNVVATINVEINAYFELKFIKISADGKRAYAYYGDAIDNIGEIVWFDIPV